MWKKFRALVNCDAISAPVNLNMSALLKCYYSFDSVSEREKLVKKKQQGWDLMCAIILHHLCEIILYYIIILYVLWFSESLKRESRCTDGSIYFSHL